MRTFNFVMNNNILHMTLYIVHFFYKIIHFCGVLDDKCVLNKFSLVTKELINVQFCYISNVLIQYH